MEKERSDHQKKTDGLNNHFQCEGCVGHPWNHAIFCKTVDSLVPIDLFKCFQILGIVYIFDWSLCPIHHARLGHTSVAIPESGNEALPESSDKSKICGALVGPPHVSPCCSNTSQLVDALILNLPDVFSSVKFKTTSWTNFGKDVFKVDPRVPPLALPAVSPPASPVPSAHRFLSLPVGKALTSWSPKTDLILGTL